ncbi:MAG: envelope stress response membrane protein PspB [Parvularculaceae bacterium]
MEDVFPAVAIVAIIFVAFPAVLLHYQAEFRKMKTISTDDERLVDDLWKTAQRLERRVDALETILDKEAPDWRRDYPERPNA